MNKILIIQTAFLGDVILATAAISEAKRISPEAQIDVLVKKGNESLLQNNPDINTVFVFNKSQGKLKAMFSLIRQFRSNKYDLVVNFHRFGSSGFITMLSGGKKKYGFKKNPFSFSFTKSFPHEIGDGTHEVTRNLSLLKEFGANDIAKPKMYPSEADFEKVSGFKLSPYVCMAPASVWFTKQMPEHKWIELINNFDKEQAIYLLGAPSDIELCNRIKENSKNKSIEVLAGKLSLLESAALMKDAKHCYVNDSGPLHIASAMNAPVTAFYCSTVPAFGFGPLSDDSRILEVTGLDCKPCGLHGFKTCPKGHFKCGEIKLPTY